MKLQVIDWYLCSKNKNHAVEITDIGNGQLQVVSVPTYAHGLHEGDVVIIQYLGLNHILHVSSIVDAFSFTVDMMTAFAAEAVEDDSEAKLIFTGLCKTSYLFHQRNKDPIHSDPRVGPKRFGFHACDVLWTQECADQMIISPFQYDLSHVTYLNICLESPTLQHNYVQRDEGGHQNKLILAKIILFPQVRMERLYPMSEQGLGLTNLSLIKLAVRNPDNTLYNFHGCDWSATLVFVIPMRKDGFDTHPIIHHLGTGHRNIEEEKRRGHPRERHPQDGHAID